MNSALIIYAVFSTSVAVWALFQLSVERSLSRLDAQFRESDRKFYRGWENIWFAQLEKTTGRLRPAKPKVRPKKKS
jgi:hypothetical protein